MTPGKFDWFLHTMLFLQTKYVLERGEEKASAARNDDDGDDGDDDGEDV
jgi:hypothetical protein